MVWCGTSLVTRTHKYICENLQFMQSVESVGKLHGHVVEGLRYDARRGASGAEGGDKAGVARKGLLLWLDRGAGEGGGGRAAHIGWCLGGGKTRTRGTWPRRDKHPAWAADV